MFTNIEKSDNVTENYEILLTNIEYYVIKGDKLVTNLSNLSALLDYFLDDINWVGFYLFDGEKLYLGPFQGLPACSLISLGNGVCGTSAESRKSIIVNDVHKFKNHIGCDSESNSEIVIPIIKNNELIGILDIDSQLFSRFNKTDKLYLEKVIVKLVDKL